MLSWDLCPTLNWTNGLGSLVTFLPDYRTTTQQVLQTEEETSCRFNVVHAHQVYWLIQVTLKLECDFHQWDDVSCTW